MFEQVDDLGNGIGTIVALTDVEFTLETRREGYEYRRAHFDPVQVVTRAKVGTLDLHGLSASEVDEIMHMEAWCLAFLDRQRRGLCARSDVSMAVTIPEIFAGMVASELGRLDAVGNAMEARDRLDLRKPPGPKTLRRWIKRLVEGGMNPAALRLRHFRAGDRSPRFTPDVLAAISKTASAYMSMERPTLAACHELLAGEVGRLNAELGLTGEAEIKVPSLHALRAAVQANGPFAVHAARYGLAAAKVKFDKLGEGVDATRFGERFEIDEWQVQLQVLLVALDEWETMTPEQRRAAERVRLWLCVVIDACTRCIVGLSLSPTPNAANALSALAMSVRDNTALARAHGCRTPWDMACTPEMVVSDSGSSFRDLGFRKAVTDLCGAPVVLPAGHPELRGRNERVLSTFNKQLLCWTPGKTFSNVVDKGRYDAVARAVLPESLLEQILVRYVGDKYHNKPHAGLGWETPRNAYLRVTSTCKALPPPGPSLCRHVFGTEFSCRLGRHGVRVFGHDYTSDALHDAFLSRHLGDVRVRLDARDIGVVSVWIGDGWVSCPCRSEDLSGIPLSAYVAVREDLQRRHGVDAKLSEPTVLAAVQAIRGTIARAVELTSLSARQPTQEDIENLRRRFDVGFSTPATRAAVAADPGADPMAGALAGTGPGSPSWVEQHGAEMEEAEAEVEVNGGPSTDRRPPDTAPIGPDRPSPDDDLASSDDEPRPSDPEDDCTVEYD